ncbi:MAG: hypothetical protein V7707_03440 [Motiliproteus sp.]
MARGRVGLSLNENGLAMAHFDARRDVPLRCQQLEQCRLDTPELLKTAVSEWNLAACATSWVLSPGQYHLLLVEAPAVDAAEMAEALRWRIKDMVSFDVAEVVLDYFAVPEDAYRGRSNMLYVAVIEQPIAMAIEALTQAAGLQLDTIEVPELSLLRLKALEGETLATAVLGLQSPHSLINLVSEDQLYLTRQVETSAELISVDATDIESRAGNMVLDLQRSLDYYESQIGKPPCLRLLVCPLQPGETPLLGQLRYNLAVELVQLDLGEHFSCEPALTPLLQSQVMLAVAAVLPEADQ